jgi:hypothetical protein
MITNRHGRADLQPPTATCRPQTNDKAERFGPEHGDRPGVPELYGSDQELHHGKPDRDAAVSSQASEPSSSSQNSAGDQAVEFSLELCRRDTARETMKPV